MGVGPYRRLDETWVHDSTYEDLFNILKDTAADPEILLVNGVIFKNGTTEEILSWYKLPPGTPDVLAPGDYSLVFRDEANEVIGETSFDAPFLVHIEPTAGLVSFSAEYGIVETDFATFAFATEYPSGTSKVEVVNSTDPQKPVLLEVDASSIKTYGHLCDKRIVGKDLHV